MDRGIWRQAVLLYIGGMGYGALELLWRGWTHGSMFLVGGICFLLLGALARRTGEWPLLVRAVAGACLVTAAELLSGLVINGALRLHVWDYSHLPYNLWGQICGAYFFLWIWASMGAILLDRPLRRALFRE